MSFSNEYSKDITIGNDSGRDTEATSTAFSAAIDKTADFTKEEERLKETKPVFRLYKPNMATASSVFMEEDYEFLTGAKNMLSGYIMDTIDFF